MYRQVQSNRYGTYRYEWRYNIWRWRSEPDSGVPLRPRQSRSKHFFMTTASFPVPWAVVPRVLVQKPAWCAWRRSRHCHHQCVLHLPLSQCTAVSIPSVPPSMSTHCLRALDASLATPLYCSMPISGRPPAPSRGRYCGTSDTLFLNTDVSSPTQSILRPPPPPLPALRSRLPVHAFPSRVSSFQFQAASCWRLLQPRAELSGLQEAHRRRNQLPFHS